VGATIMGSRFPSANKAFKSDKRAHQSMQARPAGRACSLTLADRTDRSLMLAWLAAIRPIAAVAHQFAPAFQAPLALRLSRSVRTDKSASANSQAAALGGLAAQQRR